jgi:hypothetical protein
MTAITRHCRKSLRVTAKIVFNALIIVSSSAALMFGRFSIE